MTGTAAGGRRSRAAGQRGLAMVEFVITAPILIFLMFAIADISWGFTQSCLLADSVRDAARYLAANTLVGSGSTGVINLSGAFITTTKNLVVYGNPAGSGSPILPGLKTSMVTIASDTSGDVSISIVGYSYSSIIGGSIPELWSGGSSVSTSGITLTAFNTLRAL